MLRPRYLCNVDGCEFQLIHRLEGRWSGVVEPGGRLASSHLEFVDTNGALGTSNPAIGAHWRLTETLTSPTGFSTIETSKLIPVANGTLSVIQSGGKQASTRTTIREASAQVLVAQTFDRRTNKCLMLETTTVLDPQTCTTRARVSQIFDHTSGDNGSAVNVFCVTEARTSDNVNLVPRETGGRRPKPPVRV